jgi:ribosomal protein S18 acetylase RimI-like enzyme
VDDHADFVRAARSEELPQALDLLFRHLAPSERRRRALNLLQLVGNSPCPHVAVFILTSTAGTEGAIVCEVLPGRTGLAWLPQVACETGQQAKEDTLTQRGIEWLTQQGALVLQAVLSPEETPRAGPLLRNGFMHATTLHYLRHSLRQIPCSKPTPGWSIEPYCDQNADLFHQTLLHSYEDSLDCPELNGRRDLGDIIAGYRAHGEYNAELWWLVRVDDRPAGVLITAAVHEDSAHEVAYVGVVPGRRRKGLARETMARALAEMRARKSSQVTISVDCRNQPALRLYASLGFEEFDRREVYLRV